MKISKAGITRGSSLRNFTKHTVKNTVEKIGIFALSEPCPKNYVCIQKLIDKVAASNIRCLKPSRKLVKSKSGKTKIIRISQLFSYENSARLKSTA